MSFAEVYIGAEEAIRNIFPDFQEYNIEKHIFESQEFEVYSILRNREVIGWAVVTDEMGKNKPITFLVGIDKHRRVSAVYILEFRDLFGSEIKRKSFLRQFQGKSFKDAISVGRDIDAVTGATISSQAATFAVKKSLAIIEKIQKE